MRRAKQQYQPRHAPTEQSAAERARRDLDRAVWLALESGEDVLAFELVKQSAAGSA